MEINKFDLNVHDINRVADLIVNAQIGGDCTDWRRSHRMVMDLIKAGNNFLGHENIYISSSGEYITGLTIGYRGRGKDEFRTLIRLLFSLRLSEFVSYLSFTANMIHGGFTPDVDNDEYYISVLAVDERFRRKGIGSFLLRHTIMTAKDENCRSVVLDVDSGNEPAVRLYRKFGFNLSARNAPGGTRHPDGLIITMELTLT